MINRASIKLKKLPLLMINQSTNTDSIFCTYTKYKAIRPTPKKKLIMTNPLIRAKTSMMISMKDKSVNISDRKLDITNYNCNTERENKTYFNYYSKRNNKHFKLKTLESVDSPMLNRKKKNNMIIITDSFLTEANDNGSIPYLSCNNRSKISLHTLISFKK